MDELDPRPEGLRVEDLFGPAMDAVSTWVCMAGGDTIIAANRQFREALAAIGSDTRDLRVLLPCWGRHTGSSMSTACPCPELATSPRVPGALCRVSPPRSPVHITSHAVPSPDPSLNLRLIAIEPRTEDSIQQVSVAMARIRSALNEVEQRLLNEHRVGTSSVRPPGLSPREWDVAQALATGKRSPAVAQALGISVHTVRNHTKAIYRKLGISTQAELRRRLLTHSAKAD